MREIAFDTETTGLDPNSGHRVVELGCVEMVDKIRTGRSFQRYINPERDMPTEAEAVHGISGKFLADKPLFSEIIEDFLEFVGDAPLVIHNAAFDMKFLNFELGRLGFQAIPSTRAICTATMTRRKFPGAPASLDALCKRFNIDLAARTKHGALLDAELLADVYLELCGGRQASIALFDAAVRGTAVQAEAAPLDIPARRFEVPEGERQAHRELLTRIKNPLWAEALEEAVS